MIKTTEFSETEPAGILDGVIVLIENIKTIVVGPLVGALIGLGTVLFLPQSYISNAIISVPSPAPPALPITAAQQVATIMGSAVVLDPVIDGLGLSPGIARDIARARLAEQVKATVGKDSLVRLQVNADTPAAAQKVASAVITAWLKSTRPSELERAVLEKKLEYVKASLSIVDKVFLVLLTDSPQSSSTVSRKDVGISLVAVAELRDRYHEQILLIPNALEGVSPDAVKQAPTLPSDSTKPKRTVMIISAAAVGFIAAILWVMMSSWFNQLKVSPTTADKMARLRLALRSL